MRFENLDYCDTKMFRVGNEVYVALANPVPNELGGVEQPWNAVNLANGVMVHFKSSAGITPVWPFEFEELSIEGGS